MTNIQLLKSLHDYLKPTIERNGGEVTISNSPTSTMSLLKQGPAKWRAIIQWQNETPIGLTGAGQSMQFIIVVQGAKGLPAVQAGVAELDLLDKLNGVVDRVRAVRFHCDQVDGLPMEPRNKGWLEDKDFPSLQLFAEFSLGYGPRGVPQVAVTV